MSDVNASNAAPLEGGPDVPMFIPISLIPDVSAITAGTTVNFTFSLDSPPINSAYTVGFYSTQSQPGPGPVPPPNATGGLPTMAKKADLSMVTLPVAPPQVTPNSTGGTFSVTFDSSSLPNSPSIVTVTVSIANQNSLGLCGLSYS